MEERMMDMMKNQTRILAALMTVMMVISIFGAILYLFGGITLGNISSFVLYSRKFSGPIREIAEELGYSSPNYFCACFKKQFGTSPGQWRASRSGK